MVLTGSTGFVGTALARKWAARHRLICPNRLDVDLIASPVDLDLFVRENQAEFLIHLAHPRLYNLTNAMSEAILMMRNTLEVSRLNDLPLLYLSSLAVFSGYSDLPSIPSELSPLSESVYGQTKFVCEQLIQTYRRVYDLEVVVLRPSYVYGPGMDSTRALYKFIHKAARREPITVHRYATGFQLFDFLCIDDLADAMTASLKKKPQDPVNIGTGVGTSTLELAETIKTLTDSVSEIRVIDIDNRAPALVVDPSDAINTLEWKAATTLRDGLETLAATVPI